MLNHENIINIHFKMPQNRIEGFIKTKNDNFYVGDMVIVNKNTAKTAKKIPTAKRNNDLSRSMEFARKRMQETKVSDEELMKLKKKYDVTSLREISPSLLIVIANSMANHKFVDENEDTSKFKRYKKMVDKAIEPKTEDEEGVVRTLMMGTITAANDLRVILDNYKKEIENLKKRQNERFENIWRSIPKLSTTLKKVSIKLAAVGLAGGFWNEMYNLLKNSFNQATSYIITTVAAAGVFLFMDRMFLMMVSYAMRGIDRLLTGMKSYFIEKKYVKRKLDTLQVFGHILKEIIDNSTGQASENIDRATIKKICRTLPKI